jgi:gliding motility-associated-like protein
VAFNQTPDFSISVSSGCVPLSGVSFTDISTGGTVVSRDWDFGNGTIVLNGNPSVSTNYLTDGTFPVVLTARFSNGVTLTKTKYVIVHPKPIANFRSLDTVGCVTHRANFTDLSTSSTGTITNWQWDFGAGGGTAPSPFFDYTNTGSYQVSLIVKNSWGCSSEAESKPNYIKVYNTPTASFTSTNVSSCDTPHTVTFNNTTTGAGPIGYEWNFGDGSAISTATNPSHTYRTYGRFTVTLTAKLGNNCSNSVSTGYTNSIWVGKPTPTITSPNEVCGTSTAYFSGAATPANLVNNLKWIFTDDNSVQFGGFVGHNFTTTGLVEVILVASTYYGCTDTVRKFVNVKPGPSGDFVADRTSYCAVPFVVNFTSTTTPPNGLNYTWNFGDGTPTSNLPNPQHTYTYAGTFTVTLTITDPNDPNACAAVIQKQSYISIRIPNVNFTYIPPIGCKPLPVATTAQVSNLNDPIATYIWSWSDGPNDVLAAPAGANGFHIYQNAGVFGIKLKIITAQGCTQESIVKNVTVIDVCDDDGSGGGNAGGGFTVGKNCTNKYQINFSDTVSNSTVISWDFGDGTVVSTGTLNPISHTYTPPQRTHTVTVTRRNNTTNAISTTQKNVIIIDEKANFIPDITDICANKTVNFKTLGIDSSKIKNYTWKFGDVSPTQFIDNQTYYYYYGLWLNGNTSHLYTQNGTFNVTLYITDKLNCVDSFTYPLPINVQGPKIGFKGAPLTSCDSTQLVTFQDTSIQNGNTPIIEWTWDFGIGGSNYVTTQDTAIVRNYINSSYYNPRTITLKIKDAAGCEATLPKPSYVRGYRPKADFFSYDTLKCRSYNVFLYNISGAYNAVYKWHYGDGTTGISYYGQHTYAVDSAYDIKLVVTDENGCKDSITKQSYIKIVKPKPNFAIGDTTQCAPAAIAFRDSSQYATGWSWNFGDGGTGSTDRNPAPHIYALPGFYKVTLKITSVNGCVDSIFKWIRVRGPIGRMNATPSFGCKPYVFNANVTGQFISTYAWDYGDGTLITSSPSDSNIAHSYNNAGKYLPNVILISPEGCPYVLKLSDTLIVDSAKAFFNPLISNFCGNGVVNFTNLSKTTSFSRFTSFAWNLGDGSPIVTTQNPPAHAYTTGSYDVSLTVTTQFGCTKTFTQQAAVVAYPPPLAKIMGDSIRCRPGQYVYRSGSISLNTIADYNWKVNNQSVSRDTSLNYYFRPGNYNIKLVIRTQNGCLDSIVRSIIVDSVKANFSMVNPVRCANDLRVQFNNASSSQFGVSNVAWNFGDGQTAINSSPLHSYATFGSYNIQLIANSIHGCADTLRKPQGVIIHPLPTVSVDTVAEKCAQSTVQFTAQTNSDSVINQYQWNVNGNPAGNNPTLTYTFNTAGNYSISLFIVNSNNCNAVNTKTMVIRPLPVPRATPPTSTICINNGIRLQASDGVQYAWTPIIDLQNPNTATPFASPTQNQQYNVLVTNQYGCQKTDSVRIQVDLRVNLQYSTNKILCKGESVQLSASGNSIQYNWFPTTWLSNPNSAITTATPDTTTRYRIIGSSANVCPSDTGYVLVTVGVIPTVNLGADLQVLAGTTINLNAMTTGGVTQYLWKPTTGLSCTTCSQPNFIADKDIRYTVDVKTQYNCKASDTINIVVRCNKSTIFIPNAFTPNGDNKNDVFYVLGYGIAKIRRFTIFDRWGKVVYSRENIPGADRSYGWNGKLNDVEVNVTSVFMYIIDVECVEGTVLPFKGSVLLIR